MKQEKKSRESKESLKDAFLKLKRCVTHHIRFIFLIALSLVCHLTILDAKEAGNVAAIVTIFSGDFLVKPKAEEVFVQAKKGQFLYEGDMIKTGENSLAAITFVTGVQIKINEKTEFIIAPKGLGELDEAITVGQGQVYSKVLRSGSSFGVRTNAAVASVRGTEFDVEVKPPQKKKIKIKIKKSKILEKGLDAIIKAYQEAYAKEAKEKLALREAELKAKLEKQQAEDAEKKAKEARTAAKLADADKEKREELAKALEEAKIFFEEMKKRAEEAEIQKEKQANILKEARLLREKAEKEKKRAEKEAEKRFGRQKEEEREIESLVQEQFVSVLEGRVELMNDFGRVGINAGQRAMVFEGESPQPPEEMRPEDKPKWQEQVKLDEKDKADFNKKLVESGIVLPMVQPEEKNLKMDLETPSGKRTLHLKFKRVK